MLLTLLCHPLFAADDEAKETPPQKPIYLSMLPHFTVNLSDGTVPRFLMIKAQTQVANKETRKSLIRHMPAVRHNVLMKLSSLSSEDIRSSSQKEALRQEIAEIIRKTLTEYAEYDDVKGFFITSLVTQ